MITIQVKTIKSASSLLFSTSRFYGFLSNLFKSRFYGFLSNLFKSEDLLIDSYKIIGLTFMTVAYVAFRACMLPPPPLTP